MKCDASRVHAVKVPGIWGRFEKMPSLPLHCISFWVMGAHELAGCHRICVLLQKRGLGAITIGSITAGGESHATGHGAQQTLVEKVAHLVGQHSGSWESI